MIRRSFLALLLLLVTLFPALADDGRVREALTLTRADGSTVEFQVEVAETPEDRARGLMFREVLAPDHGMLFIFPRLERASMWMRNTPLPLDMLFVKPDGTVAQIHERAVPFSETVIAARMRVKFVLELPGGTADRVGIAVGDTLSGPALR